MEFRQTAGNLPPPASTPTELPDGWEEGATADGDIYFFNVTTGESAWEPPSSRPHAISRTPVNWNADSGGALLSSFFTPPPSRPRSPTAELPAWCARPQVPPGIPEAEVQRRIAATRLAREAAREFEKRKRREKKAAWLRALAVWPDEDADMSVDAKRQRFDKAWRTENDPGRAAADKETRRRQARVYRAAPLESDVAYAFRCSVCMQKTKSSRVGPCNNSNCSMFSTLSLCSRLSQAT